jgi:hypothetical protein
MARTSPAISSGTRATLSAAICCVTRVLPAIVLSLGPHSVNTKTLLRMCMSDKTPLALAVGCETPYEFRGNPWQAAGDEGSAILNSITNGICQAGGIEYICPQIETPQQRAKIERVFQTFEIRSLLRFSGRAFSNPQVRGKYEAEARAVTTIEELAALILRFIVDVYHNTPHDGLDGQAPRACWLETTKKYAPRAAGKPLLRRMFGERYKVTLHPNGIEIFGNWYTNPTLEKRCRDLPQRDYTAIVDEEDLGEDPIVTADLTAIHRQTSETGQHPLPHIVPTPIAGEKIVPAAGHRSEACLDPAPAQCRRPPAAASRTREGTGKIPAQSHAGKRRRHCQTRCTGAQPVALSHHQQDRRGIGI